jgi:nitrogen fixation/metabolism regulation signal transduction histidine kinase
VNERYLRSVYLAVAAIVAMMELIRYVDRFNRDVRSFMIGLLQNDFTTNYQSTGKGEGFDELYAALNRISHAFRTLSAEREVQFRYLEMLVEHVRVGIISIDAEGKIHLANQAIKDMLHKSVLMSLRSLDSFGEEFVRSIAALRTGQTELIRLHVNNELLQLSVHASEFKLEERYYKLISMQNIRSELDAREMDAWQKLIRVLSHEIMNSVAPVISLSGTLHGLVTQNNAHEKFQDPALHHALDTGLEAIKVRSEGLFNFTQTYRKLTGIPRLSLKEASLRALLERVNTLLKPRLDETGIDLTIAGADYTVTIDPGLMENVLINLVLNAVEALQGRPHPHIRLRTSLHAKGNVCIHVADNGEGMDEALMEKIFIPFFTTRKRGSGIGLAITKQILQLHSADIHVTSTPGEGTEFTIIL